MIHSKSSRRRIRSVKKQNTQKLALFEEYIGFSQQLFHIPNLCKDSRNGEQVLEKDKHRSKPSLDQSKMDLNIKIQILLELSVKTKINQQSLAKVHNYIFSPLFNNLSNRNWTLEIS